jgi:hypothetical protein
MMMIKTTLLLLLAASESHAFFTSKPSVAKSSPQADQAVAIFDKKFPFGRPPVARSKRISLGMPIADIDGTPVFKSTSVPGKRLTDITEAQARATFNELAKCYGQDEALDMVKALPVCLVFNKDGLGPSLKAFQEIFGEEQAKAMVSRNPGLLAVNPADAATVTEQTMVFSYLVGYTRPLGPVLLPLLLFLLLTPVLERLGIPIRSDFLSNFV